MTPTRYYIVFDKERREVLAAVRATSPRAAIARYASGEYTAVVATQEDMLRVGRFGCPVLDLNEASTQGDAAQGTA